jgi:hypothetical protein
MTLFPDRTEIEQFRTLLARRLGFEYEDAKLDYLAEVARRRMELTGIASLHSYLERMSSPSRGADEFRALSEQLTVNETFFFRGHLRALFFPSGFEQGAGRSAFASSRPDAPRAKSHIPSRLWCARRCRTSSIGT